MESLEHHLLYVSVTSFITSIRPLPSNAEINTTGIPVICNHILCYSEPGNPKNDKKKQELTKDAIFSIT